MKRYLTDRTAASEARTCTNKSNPLHRPKRLVLHSLLILLLLLLAAAAAAASGRTSSLLLLSNTLPSTVPRPRLLQNNSTVQSPNNSSKSSSHACEEARGEERSGGRPPRVFQRIACIGDSITYGNGSHVGKMERAGEGNFPLQLGQLLRLRYQQQHQPTVSGAVCAVGPASNTGAAPQQRGKTGTKKAAITVMNFGHSGRTMQDGFRQSYRNSSYYRDAKSSKPTLVILMMGTNDSKERHWRGPVAFRTAVESLVSEFAGLNTEPLVVLLTPPPSFFDPRKLKGEKPALRYLGKINNTRIAAEISPLMLQVPALVGPECMVLDLYGMFRERLTNIFVAVDQAERLRDRASVTFAAGLVAEYFHDGIHPTRKGHDLIAAWLAEQLVAVFESRTAANLGK